MENFAELYKQYERFAIGKSLTEELQPLLRRRRGRARRYRRNRRIARSLEIRKQLRGEKYTVDNEGFEPFRESHPNFALFGWLKSLEKQLYNKPVRIYAQYVDENGVIKERVKTIPNFRVGLIHEGDYIFKETSFREYAFFRAIVIVGRGSRKAVNPSVLLQQAFRIGITNCFLTPIKDKLMKMYNNSGSKKYQQKLMRFVKKVEKYQQKYLKGVPRDKLQSICNDLQVKVQITQPVFDEQVLTIKPNCRRPITSLKFYNTRPNHVDCVDGFSLSVNSESICLDEDELMKQIETIKKSGKYYLMEKYNATITSINTLTESYVLKNKIIDYRNEFCKLNNIALNLHHIRDPIISEFLESADHANVSMLFKPGIDPKYKNYKHIDMEKAYTQNKYFRNYSPDGEILSEELNPYYMGFLIRPYELRQTNKEIGVGIYQIVNLELGNKLEKLNRKMKIYETSCLPMNLSSPELKFLRDNGATYDIVAGCWGQVSDIDFPKWTFEKIDGVPLYSLLVGLLHCGRGRKEVVVRGYKGLRDLMLAQDITGKVDTIDELDGEIRIRFRQDGGTHAIQIPVFVQAYQRIRLLQQLLEMDITKIISVVTDGIYYRDHLFKMLKPFRFEPKEKLGGMRDCRSFIPPKFPKRVYKKYQLKPPVNDGNYRVEYWAGAGGTGKTWTACNSTNGGQNLIKIAYCAPSNKLKKYKKQEFEGLHAYTHAHILGYSGKPTIDTNKIDIINRYYNVLFIDEVSMLLDEEKDNIIKYYPNLKIIFAGDVGYQLPPTKPGRQFNMNTNINHIQLFTKSHRFIEGDPINDVLQNIRESIDRKEKWINLDLKLFNVLTRDELFNGHYYQSKDLIITHRNIEKDLYTNQFKHFKKWIMINKTKDYEKGEILYTEDKPKGSELRHGYTTHSIQGETTKEKLFIDMKNMRSRPKLLYTALSRCRSINQIYLIFEMI